MISEIGVRQPNNFIRNVFITDDEIEDFRNKYNNTSIHKSVWYYDDNDIDNANLYGDFYMDFDSHVGFEEVRADVIKVISMIKVVFKIDYNDMMFYFSGRKGIHLIIPAEIFGIEPDKDLHLLYKYIVSQFKEYTKYKTVDTQVYHRRAMLRLSESIHEKTGLYKIRITLDELLKSENIQELAKEVRKIENRKPILNSNAKQAILRYKENMVFDMKKQKIVSYDSILDFDPPCIKHLLSTTISQGERNYTATVIASHFRSRGYSNSEAEKLLMNWNIEFCYPKMPAHEIRGIIVSIYNGNKRYGCASLSRISECNSEECKLYKAK